MCIRVIVKPKARRVYGPSSRNALLMSMSTWRGSRGTVHIKFRKTLKDICKSHVHFPAFKAYQQPLNDLLTMLRENPLVEFVFVTYDDLAMIEMDGVTFNQKRAAEIALPLHAGVSNYVKGRRLVFTDFLIYWDSASNRDRRARAEDPSKSSHMLMKWVADHGDLPLQARRNAETGPMFTRRRALLDEVVELAGTIPDTIDAASVAAFDWAGFQTRLDDVSTKVNDEFPNAAGLVHCTVLQYMYILVGLPRPGGLEPTPPAPDPGVDLIEGARVCLVGLAAGQYNGLHGTLGAPRDQPWELELDVARGAAAGGREAEGREARGEPAEFVPPRFSHTAAPVLRRFVLLDNAPLGASPSGQSFPLTNIQVLPLDRFKLLKDAAERIKILATSAATQKVPIPVVDCDQTGQAMCALSY